MTQNLLSKLISIDKFQLLCFIHLYFLVLDVSAGLGGDRLLLMRSNWAANYCFSSVNQYYSPYTWFSTPDMIMDGISADTDTKKCVYSNS